MNGSETVSKRVVAGVFAIVVGLWAAYWFLAVRLIPAADGGLAARGQFGDMFGAVNALFSALAFCGLILALMLQRQALAQQQVQLGLMKVEIENTVRRQEKTYQLETLRHVYDLVLRTRPSRAAVFENRDLIRGVTTPERLVEFRRHHHAIYSSAIDAANCYHYIGFLLHSNVLEHKEQVFAEGGHTIREIWKIVGPLIEAERQLEGRGKYKQYFTLLLSELEAWDRTLANRSTPS